MSDSFIYNSLSLEDAIDLFRQWGFQVEPGPRAGETTLIIDAPDHRTYSVHPTDMLPRMAAVALRVRQQQALLADVRLYLSRPRALGIN